MFLRYAGAVALALVITYVTNELMPLGLVWLVGAWGALGKILLLIASVSFPFFSSIAAYIGGAAVAPDGRHTSKVIGAFLVPLRILHVVGVHELGGLGLIGAWIGLLTTIAFALMPNRY